MATSTMTTQSQTALPLSALPDAIQTYFRAICDLDVTTWLTAFADTAISYEPDLPPLPSAAARSQFFQGTAAAFATLRIVPALAFSHGTNRYAIHWVGDGVAKNGRPVHFEGIDVFELNAQGTIQTLWGYWHPTAMMLQVQA
jgi:steroid Delta-isomerase